MGKDGAFEDRVYRAYFGEGVNIGDIDALRRLAADVGLDPEGAAEAARSPSYELKIKDCAYDANCRSVSGVPTFFIGDYPLVGAQSEDVMRKILTRATERFAAAK